MAMVESGLGGSHINFLGAESAVSKDGHTLGEDFDESAADAVGLLAGLTAVETYLAGPEDSDKRSVSVKDLEIAVPGRNFNGIRGLIDEDVVGSDEPDL